MSYEDDELVGNDDELNLVDDDYVRRLYPLEERPFSQAWRRAIGFKRAYRDYFDRQEIRSMSYRGWTPRVAMIKKDLDEMPASDAIFLAALVSFYNGDSGGRLLRGLGAQGMSDIAASLDQQRRQILADLLVNFVGW
ncbi:hypothetical protein [Mycolicibacter sinensis]|uniref:Uncharacterized protein n=1 Tax=Mycolicibacter sinensis (strain JDM601) TaxID=875328 RepID=A0A1A2XGT1_MYCSD|nr:hypothetical protein [Mycolicibacter sinensis]OBI24307.1 hypothetical protein A5710_00935 [Mycolicibacter sinensis]